MVVLTKDLLGFSELVINRGIGADVVAGIAFYKALPIAAQMFPFATLVGCLVALGRLGADREILALEASGVAAPRLVWPVVSFAAGMTVVSLAMSLVVGPWAGRSQQASLERVAREKPWSRIRAGAISTFGGVQLEAREVSKAGDRLEGVLVFMPGLADTVFARSAQIGTDASGSITLTLRDGSALLPARPAAREVRFETLTTQLPQTAFDDLRSAADAWTGMPLDDLTREAARFDREGNAGGSRAAVELHRRAALPFATLAFGFLAVPLFLTRRSFSRSSGGVIAVLSTVAYYGLVQLGEGLIQNGKLSVAAGVWLPNAVLTGLAVVLLTRVLRERALGQVFDRPRRGATANETVLREVRPRRFALPRYVGARFATLALLSFGVLFSAYLLIDVMERLEWFARYRATGTEILRFYGARVWLLASRAIPMAILVGTSLTVSLLAVEGELIGMRACGIPVARAMLPVLILSALFTPFYFALNDVVVPRTNALADVLKQTEIKQGRGSGEERDAAGEWFRSGNQLIEAQRFDRERGEAQTITLYELGADGHPTSRTDARSARHIGHGEWRLAGAARVEASLGSVHSVAAPAFVRLGEELSSEVDTMHYSVAELGREAAEIEAAGYDASVLRTDYHRKLAEPLACLVLPAVVMLFAVGGPPFPGPAQTLLVSGIIGVSYILFTGVAASLGHGKAVPPVVGGFAPTVFFTALAGWFGFRLWRRL